MTSDPSRRRDVGAGEVQSAGLRMEIVWCGMAGVGCDLLGGKRPMECDGGVRSWMVRL